MECVICYNEIAKDAGYNKWNCTHSFHKNCTRRWNKSCPICRCEDKNKNLQQDTAKNSLAHNINDPKQFFLFFIMSKR